MKKRTVTNLILTVLAVCISAGALVFARFESEKILSEKVTPDIETIEQVKADGRKEEQNILVAEAENQLQIQAEIMTPPPTPFQTPEPTLPPEPVVLSGKFVSSDNSAYTLEYELLLPAGDPGKLPLIVYLYGDQMGGIMNYGIAKQAQEIYGMNFPFAILIPSTEEIFWDGWIPSVICELVSSLAEENDLDMEHIILTGHGRGGSGTWITVNENADFFSAAVPISAGLDIDGTQFKNTPVWAMCGDGWYDQGNYCRWMEYLTEVVTVAGGKGKFSVVEVGQDGDITALAYTKDVFEWMISQ